MRESSKEREHGTVQGNHHHYRKRKRGIIACSGISYSALKHDIEIKHSIRRSNFKFLIVVKLPYEDTNADGFEKVGRSGNRLDSLGRYEAWHMTVLTRDRESSGHEELHSVHWSIQNPYKQTVSTDPISP